MIHVMAVSKPSTEIVAELRQRMRALGQTQRGTGPELASTGCAAIDSLFSGGGIRRGTFIEWVGYRSANEAAIASLLVARHLVSRDLPWMLIDPTQSIHAPTLQSLGFPLSQVLYVTPPTDEELLWSCDQALRCRSLPLLWVLEPKGDATTFRRYQIAAEDAGALAMFVFGPQRRLHRCWGEVRLQVEVLPSLHGQPRFRIEVLRSRTGNAGLSVIVGVDETGQFHDEETLRLPVVPELAHPTAGVG